MSQQTRIRDFLPTAPETTITKNLMFINSIYKFNVSLWDLKSLTFRRPLPVRRTHLGIELASACHRSSSWPGKSRGWCLSWFNNQSGFQPTIEPTGFQLVVVQLTLRTVPSLAAIFVIHDETSKINNFFRDCSSVAGADLRIARQEQWRIDSGLAQRRGCERFIIRILVRMITINATLDSHKS